MCVFHLWAIIQDYAVCEGNTSPRSGHQTNSSLTLELFSYADWASGPENRLCTLSTCLVAAGGVVCMKA